MNLPHFSIQRPITILMIFIGSIIVGVMGLMRLPVELMPNASFGSITIFIGVRGGLPPPEIENNITKIVEDAVATAGNLRHIISTSKKDRSVITLEFEPGINMDYAAQEVREKFSKIKHKLPREIEKPIIAKYEESDVPVVIIGLTGSRYSPEQIRQVVDEKIKDKLLQIEGVANIEIGGGRERKILIDLDQVRMQSLNIPIQKVLAVLSQNNINLLAGEVERTKDKYTVRTTGAFKTIEDIGAIHVAVLESKSIVRLSDIAKVQDSYLEPESYSRLDRRDSVSLYIQKESTANTVKVVDKILKKMEDLKKQIDTDIQVNVVSDQAKFIRTSINNVLSSLIIGGGLAAGVLLLFLCKISHTLVIITVIPISVMLTFLGMYFFNISLNIMSLSGLALGIGMLLDNSIVVLENIFRLRNPLKTTPDPDGHLARQTALQGAQEMMLPIVASTITTIVVFVPITFINKQVRLIYSDLSFTVIFSLVASLVVAVSLLPLMESWIPIGSIKKSTTSNIFSSFYFLTNLWLSITKLFRTGMAFLKNKCGAPPHVSSMRFMYRRLLIMGIARRYWIYLMLFIVFFISIGIYDKKLDKEFIASGEQSEFTIFIELPTGTKLDISDKVVSEVEKKLNDLPEMKKFVKSTQARVEGWSSKIYVSLVPREERARTSGEIISSLRPELKSIGKEFEAFIYFSEPQASRELTIDVFGFDYKKLADIASSLANQMGSIAGLQDIKLRYRPGRPEAQFVIDKVKASYVGLSIRTIAEILHAQIRGMRAGFFHTEATEVEIIPRLDEKYRRDMTDLKNITLNNERGDTIFVNQIADLVFDLSPSEIWRKNKQRMIQVSANLENISLGRAAEATNKIIAGFAFPKEYFAQIGGDYEQMLQNEREFIFALIISIILVYAVLAMLFESYIQPFIIMMTVPMAMIGVVFMLLITIKTVTIGVLIGVLMLGGIVVNNAIILIDQINKCISGTTAIPTRSHLFRIIFSTAKLRLRPILMTTITTLLGLVPMAVDRSDGAAMWRPLAITVIGGLSVSTILTLFAVPGLYIIVEDIKKWAKKIF